MARTTVVLYTDSPLHNPQLSFPALPLQLRQHILWLQIKHLNPCQLLPFKLEHITYPRHLVCSDNTHINHSYRMLLVNRQAHHLVLRGIEMCSYLVEDLGLEVLDAGACTTPRKVGGNVPAEGVGEEGGVERGGN